MWFVNQNWKKVLLKRNITQITHLSVNFLAATFRHVRTDRWTDFNNTVCYLIWDIQNSSSTSISLLTQYFTFFFFRLSSTSGMCFRLMAYFDSNWSHFKYSIDKLTMGAMVQSTSLLDMRRSHSCLYISSFQPWLPWDTPGESQMLISLVQGRLDWGRRTRACPATGVF